MKKIILIATVVCIIVVAVILVLDKRPTGKYRVVKIPGEDVGWSP